MTPILPSLPEPWRRRVDVLGIVLLVVIVAPFVAFMVPQAVGATNSYVVVSGSMGAPPPPVLEAGDVVFVYQTPPERIESGDVITFESGPNRFTTHRVMDVVETDDGLAFQTKGDANEEADPRPVPADIVVGVVRFHVPLIGHAIVWAGSTTGIVLLLVVPSVLLVLNEVVTLARELKSGDTDTAGTGENER